LLNDMRQKDITWKRKNKITKEQNLRNSRSGRGGRLSGNEILFFKRRLRKWAEGRANDVGEIYVLRALLGGPHQVGWKRVAHFKRGVN